MSGRQIAENRGGRPSERDEPKRAAIALRTTPDIKERLLHAASERGRSITQEVEARIEESFEAEDLYGDHRTRLALGALAGKIQKAEAATGKHWLDDIRTHAAAAALIDNALRGFEPTPKNVTAINKSFEAFREAQIIAYSRARILENDGLLIRPVGNALSPNYDGDTRDPSDPMAHAGVYKVESSILIDTLHGEENRKYVAAANYFGLSLAVQLRAPPDQWEFEHMENPPSADERLGMLMFLKRLPEEVEEAVKRRNEFTELYAAVSEARKSGRSLSESWMTNAVKV